MSWQGACLVGLTVVLGGGFWWYERSRPPARIVALVAALAALGVAGRIVLAPIPNVVATTDIVLIAGYVLGAGPGFVVGALAALVSNFFLGQGPWTPWQMAGWGMVGIGGAALATVFGRQIGRWPLAVAAAAAGLAYGALLDLSAMVSFGGEQSLDRYLALSARGVPFNLAHAIGNFAFAIVAGPAFVSILQRFQRRSTIVWLDPMGSLSGPLAIFLILAGGFVAVSAARPTEAEAAGLSDAQNWLFAQQNPDGGFPASPGDDSSVAMTGWASLGLEAAGVNPQDVYSNAATPIDYLRVRANDLASTGDLERTILVAAGAGVDPHDFGGRDLVSALAARQRSNGSWEGQINLTAYGILAIGAAGGGASLGQAAGFLSDAQNSDRGWGFAPGAASDADSTGAVMEALRVSGGYSPTIDAAAGYLRRSQLRDGGWPLSTATASNAQSTSLAIQGLLAAGVGSSGGLDFLFSRQTAVGSVNYSRNDARTPVWVTAQSMMAIAGKTLPTAQLARTPGVDPVGAPSRGGGPGGGGPGGSGSRRGGGRPGGSAPGGSKRPGGKPGSGKGRGQTGAARGVGVGGTRGVRSTIANADGIEGQLDAALGDGGRSTDSVWIVAALAVLAVLLLAGYFFYRRRLPSSGGL